MNTLIYYFFKVFSFLFNRLPLSWRFKIFRLLLSLSVLLVPRLRQVSMINLNLAFPAHSPEWKNQVFAQTLDNLARILVDIFRVGELDEDWVRKHIEFPGLEELERIRAAADYGVVYLTGHLGSFELLTLCVKTYAAPMAFVARPLSPEGLFRWWQESRTKHGSELIYRKGAVRQVFKYLKKKRDIGLLFDQNVTRDQAIFVDWFGRPAATTRIIAGIATTFTCPLIVIGIQSLENDRYRINLEHIRYDDLQNNPDLTKEQKAFLITDRVSQSFQKMIKASPGEWFWFHRRWKTGVLPGEGEQIYRK